ncbi:MAG TPA: hypothetical protein HPP91_09245, partial [Gammaproteobacteria bacterium]|nr:hypothetical protein [Gammaproteobacteria bacterium]
GLGLGVWGPVAVGVLSASAAYGYYRHRKSDENESAVENSTEESPSTESVEA